MTLKETTSEVELDLEQFTNSKTLLKLYSLIVLSQKNKEKYN